MIRLLWALIVLVRLMAIGVVLALNAMMLWYWVPFILFTWRKGPGVF